MNLKALYVRHLKIILINKSNLGTFTSQAELDRCRRDVCPLNVVSIIKLTLLTKQIEKIESFIKFNLNLKIVYRGHTSARNFPDNAKRMHIASFSFYLNTTVNSSPIFSVLRTGLPFESNFLFPKTFVSKVSLYI